MNFWSFAVLIQISGQASHIFSSDAFSKPGSCYRDDAFVAVEINNSFLALAYWYQGEHVRKCPTIETTSSKVINPPLCPNHLVSEK